MMIDNGMALNGMDYMTILQGTLLTYRIPLLLALCSLGNGGSSTMLRKRADGDETPDNQVVSRPDWGEPTLFRRLNNRGIEFPFARYQVFEDFDGGTQSTLETSLGYSEESWNSPGTALVESLPYDSIPPAGKQTVTDTLGMEQDQWDCYINHYRSFPWDSLESLEVQNFWRVLGWDEARWNEQGSPPPSEEKTWIELTAPERAAATELCFLPETWDDIPLDQWDELPEPPPTGAPGPAPSPVRQPTVVQRPNRAPVPAMSRPTQQAPTGRARKPSPGSRTMNGKPQAKKKGMNNVFRTGKKKKYMHGAKKKAVYGKKPAKKKSYGMKSKSKSKKSPKKYRASITVEGFYEEKPRPRPGRRKFVHEKQ